MAIDTTLGGDLTTSGKAVRKAQLKAALEAANQIAEGVFDDEFAGDDDTTDFTLSGTPSSVNALDVYISGVHQVPTTNYTLSGATLTFAAAPPEPAEGVTYNIYVKARG